MLRAVTPDQRDQPQRGTRVLCFDVQSGPRERLEQLLEEGRAAPPARGTWVPSLRVLKAPPRVQLAQLVPRHTLDGTYAVRGAIDGVVVDDDDATVGARVHVQL